MPSYHSDIQYICYFTIIMMIMMVMMITTTITIQTYGMKTWISYVHTYTMTNECYHIYMDVYICIYYIYTYTTDINVPIHASIYSYKYTYIQIYLHTYNRVDNTYSVLDIYAGAMIQQELNHFNVTILRGIH